MDQFQLLIFKKHLGGLFHWKNVVKKYLGRLFLWKNVLLKDLPLNPLNINFDPPISGADDFWKVSHKSMHSDSECHKSGKKGEFEKLVI